MIIQMLETVAKGGGSKRVWDKGKTYEVTAGTGLKLIARGAAKQVSRHAPKENAVEWRTESYRSQTREQQRQAAESST